MPPRENRSLMIGVKLAKNPSHLNSVYLAFRRVLWHAPTALVDHLRQPALAVGHAVVGLVGGVVLCFAAVGIWLFGLAATMVLGFAGHLSPSKKD